MKSKKEVKKHHGICDICKNIYRKNSLIIFKGKTLCVNCRKKEPSYIMNDKLYYAIIGFTGRRKITLEKALQKEYYVRTHTYKKKNTDNQVVACNISVPSCFVNKKVKLLLI